MAAAVAPINTYEMYQGVLDWLDQMRDTLGKDLNERKLGLKPALTPDQLRAILPDFHVVAGNLKMAVTALYRTPPEDVKASTAKAYLRVIAKAGPHRTEFAFSTQLRSENIRKVMFVVEHLSQMQAKAQAPNATAEDARLSEMILHKFDDEGVRILGLSVHLDVDPYAYDNDHHSVVWRMLQYYEEHLAGAHRAIERAALDAQFNTETASLQKQVEANDAAIDHLIATGSEGAKAYNDEYARLEAISKALETQLKPIRLKYAALKAVWAEPPDWALPSHMGMIPLPAGRPHLPPIMSSVPVGLPSMFG